MVCLKQISSEQPRVLNMSDWRAHHTNRESEVNSGHLEGAAGVAGLVKSMLALQRGGALGDVFGWRHETGFACRCCGLWLHCSCSRPGTVPPNVHFAKLNPTIDLEDAFSRDPVAQKLWLTYSS